MFGIYLKTSWRHLTKSRLYSFINIMGLATGITAMLLAILYWRNESGFDTFHNNNPHLYRITTLKENKETAPVTVGGTGQVQGPAFKLGVPELKSYTRVMGGDIYSDIIGADKILKLRPLFVDNNFLEVFTFPLINGNPHSALVNINSVVLTETAARKLFNSTDIIGKILEPTADPSYERLGKPMVVTAVVKDPPQNSSLQFDMLVPFSYMQLAFTDENWLNAYLGTFVVLDPFVDMQRVAKVQSYL